MYHHELPVSGTNRGSWPVESSIDYGGLEIPPDSSIHLEKIAIIPLKIALSMRTQGSSLTFHGDSSVSGDDSSQIDRAGSIGSSLTFSNIWVSSWSVFTRSDLRIAS